MKSNVCSGTHFRKRYPHILKGFTSGVIHQTTKDGNLRQNTWTFWHPYALNVRWSDEDNYEFVKDVYPHYLPLYESMALPIQKTDIVRLLYLHMYGGLYVDDDYEAFTDVLSHLSKSKINIVKSPVLMNEVMQNSMMYSPRPRERFFLNVVDNIQTIMSFIDDGCNISKSCAILDLFHNPLTQKLMNIAMTQYITGSAVLDKTHVLMKPSSEIQLLDDAFFSGPIAVHLHANSWVNVMNASVPILMTVLFLTSCFFVSFSWFFSKK